MSATLSLYCRLCAEQKLVHELINLTSNFKFREDIVDKLSIFSSNLVDFSINTLPQTVCTHCIETLNTSYEFFTKIKMSQLDLTYLASTPVKIEIEDSDNSVESESESESESGSESDRLTFEIEPPGIELPETEAKSEQTDLKIAFDGYNVTYCENYCDSLISWSTYPWICSCCDAQFKNLGALRMHSKELHNVCFSMKCADCTDDVFVDDFESFVEHVRRHRRELNQFCQHCNMKLEPDNLTDHVAKHKKQMHCFSCGEFFEDGFKWHNHLSRYQKSSADYGSWNNYEWACSECSGQFKDQESLRKHTKEEHQKCFAMQCAECPETVESFGAFVEHVRKHKPSLKYYCQYCNFEYSEANQIIFHILKHVRNQCKICGESFLTPAALRTHVDAYKQITKPQQVRQRNPTKKIYTEQDLTCNVCHKVTKNINSLKQHKTLHTRRQRDHVCDRCGKAFFAVHTLKVHKLLHDDNAKNEVCKICKKEFLNLTRLKKHVRTHTTEKNFECDTCHKRFKVKTQLSNHMACHSDVKRFSCQYCGKAFRYGSCFKIHLRLHTGDRPYVCRVCGMEFANWSNCNKHMIRRHGTRLAKTVNTPQGKVPIHSKTGKPKNFQDPELVKEWSDQILRKKGRKKKTTRE